MRISTTALSMVLATCIVCLCRVECVDANGDDMDKAARPSIRTTGEATVSVKPDKAELQIGVVTQAQSAQAAAAENAKSVDATLAMLRKELGGKGEIQTVSYSLTPDYRTKPGGAPVIAGYTATNIVQVTTDDLTLVGKLIDLATQSGSNRIQSLRFMLKDEQSVRAEALKRASMKAREKAQAIASALGVRIVRVLLAQEGGPTIYPMMGRAAMAGEAGVPTPIEPGTVDVQVTVSLTVEVNQEG